MHHASHRKIHALGAARTGGVRDAIREESAGSRSEQVLFRHSEARQRRVPWHGFVRRC